MFAIRFEIRLFQKLKLSCIYFTLIFVFVMKYDIKFAEVKKLKKRYVFLTALTSFAIGYLIKPKLDSCFPSPQEEENEKEHTFDEVDDTPNEVVDENDKGYYKVIDSSDFDIENMPNEKLKINLEGYNGGFGYWDLFIYFDRDLFEEFASKFNNNMLRVEEELIKIGHWYYDNRSEIKDIPNHKYDSTNCKRKRVSVDRDIYHLHTPEGHRAVFNHLVKVYLGKADLQRT